MEVTKISQESLQKALETLGLTKAADAVVDPKVEELKKAEDEAAAAKATLQAEYDEMIQKAEELKNKIEGKETPKVEPIAAPAATSTTTDLTKAIEEIKKGFDEKIQALGVVFAASNKNDEGYEELKKAVDNQKGIIDFLGKKIGYIEQQPLDRKSVAPGTKAVERFEKAEDTSGTKVISLSNRAERAELVEMIYKAVEEKGYDAQKKAFKDTEFAKAVNAIEQTFCLSDNEASSTKLANRIKKEFNVVVVR